MRLYVLLIFLLATSAVLKAQQNQTFKGVVVDAAGGQTIPFATVAVFNNNVLVNGASTDNSGRFELAMKEPFTRFEVSFIGYETTILNVNGLNTFNDIVFVLKSLDIELDEVVLEAEQTTTVLKVDRKIINLGADLQQSGATTLEAFDQITEIQTDLGTGTLSLRGSGNVRLLINGKPSGLNATELLEQLPASQVQKVEIITSPSAKNQADGLSGIINVILKKNTASGWNTNLNAGVGTKRYNYGVDGNYNYSWVNFRWNISQAGREMDSKQTIFQGYSNGDTRDFFAPHDFSGLVRKMDVGVDFFINENNTLSFGFDYTNDYHSFYNNTFYTNVTDRDDFVYTRNSSHTHKTTNVNANYRTKFENENHFLELDYQFSRNKNLLPAADFEEVIFLFDEERKNTNTLNALAIDYSLPLNDNIVVETGLSWNSRKLDSENFFNPAEEPETLDIFNYEESLFGIYALSNFTVNKFNWQLGLRYEYFESSSANFSNEQTTNLTFPNLFPSLHVSYSISQSNTLNMGYSRRVSRPNFRHLNPFQARNQYFEWLANPQLKPEFSNNFETNYLYNNTKLSAAASLFYRYRTDVIERLQEIDEIGVQLNIFDNIGEKHSYGIEVDLGYKLANFWKSQVTANYYHTTIYQDVFLTWDELYSSNIIFKNTFKISRGLNADLSYRHNFKTQNTFNFIEPRDRIDVAVRLKLLENRLALNLRVVDVLDNNLMFRTTRTPDVIQNEVWRFQSQTFGFLFNMSYKLFQNKGKTRNRKDRDYRYGGTTD